MESHRLPFGWRTPRGAVTAQKGAREVLVPHPVEQRLRDRILALHAAGSGAHRIARVRNEDGEKNPRTLGRWSKGTVASILRTAKRRSEVGAA